jgi:hypothetical protein
MTATFRQAMSRAIFGAAKCALTAFALTLVSDISATGRRATALVVSYAEKSSARKCMAAMNRGIGTENPDSLHSSITWINLVARE